MRYFTKAFAPTIAQSIALFGETIVNQADKLLHTDYCKLLQTRLERGSDSFVQTITNCTKFVKYCTIFGVKTMTAKLQGTGC